MQPRLRDETASLRSASEAYGRAYPKSTFGFDVNGPSKAEEHPMRRRRLRGPQCETLTGDAIGGIRASPVMMPLLIPRLDLRLTEQE